MGQSPKVWFWQKNTDIAYLANILAIFGDIIHKPFTTDINFF